MGKIGNLAGNWNLICHFGENAKNHSFPTQVNHKDIQEGTIEKSQRETRDFSVISKYLGAFISEIDFFFLAIQDSPLFLKGFCIGVLRLKMSKRHL